MSKFNFKLQLQQKGLKNPAEAMLKAQVAALNRVGSETRTFATRNIRDVFNVPYGKVRENIKPKQARAGNLVYEISASGKRIGLVHFKPRPGVKGASVEVRKGRRKEEPGMFIVKKLSGNVFKRKTEKRFPLQRQYGPSVPMMFSTTKLRELLNKFVAEKMPKELAGKLKFYMQFVK